MEPPPDKYYAYWEYDADYHALMLGDGSMTLYDKNDDRVIYLFSNVHEQFYISKWIDYSDWVSVWRKK